MTKVKMMRNKRKLRSSHQKQQMALIKTNKLNRMAAKRIRKLKWKGNEKARLKRISLVCSSSRTINQGDRPLQV